MVLDSLHAGRNHDIEAVRDWEHTMVKYKKGYGTLHDGDGVDDAIDSFSMPDLRLYAITPTLSHLLLSDGGLHTLRFRGSCRYIGNYSFFDYVD